jgi:hypothetical protein
MDIGVVQPFGMGEHRHARVALDPFDQRAAAARDDQVDRAGAREHRGDERAILGRRDLHAARRQAGFGEPRLHRIADRGRRPPAFRAAAQDHGIARFHADRGGIGADIGPAFIDHADHPERLRHAADQQAVGPAPFGEHAVERIGQVGHRLDTRRHRLDPRRGEREPVAECAGDARVAIRRRDVIAVRRENRRRPITQRRRRRPQRRGPDRRIACFEPRRRVPRLARDRGECGRRVVRLARPLFDHHIHAPMVARMTVTNQPRARAY